MHINEDAKLNEVRITDAKQASISLRQPDRLILSVAYQIQDFKDLRKVWRFEEFVLKLMPSQKAGSRVYECLPADAERDQGQDAFVTTEYADESNVISQTQDSYCNVTDIQMEPIKSDNESIFEFSTFVHIWNQETCRSELIDTKGQSQVIDAATKELIEQVQEINQDQLLQFQTQPPISKDGSKDTEE